jgi:hypothetical protein
MVKKVITEIVHNDGLSQLILKDQFSKEISASEFKNLEEEDIYLEYGVLVFVVNKKQEVLVTYESILNLIGSGSVVKSTS